METEDRNQSPGPDEEPTREQRPEPPTEPTRDTGAPRKLYRSRSDRVIGGVCGGLGKHFGIDPVILRVLAVVLLFAGGGSLIAYLIMLVVVPNEPLAGAPEGAAQGQPSDSERSKPLVIAALVALLLVGWPFLLGGGFLALGLALPLLILGGLGLLVWWLVSGESPRGGGAIARAALLGFGVLLLCFAIFLGGAWAAGVGGGTVAAALVIAAGVALVVGAFAGGLRFLILPALALAIGVGFVQAAGVDLNGGVGKQEYRPASAAELRDRYKLGIGQLVLDLRRAKLPKGDTPVRLDVGVGDALLLVPKDVCVASKADIGIGGVDVFDRDNGGVDVAWRDRPRAPRGRSRVVVDADVGVGALEVRHDRRDRFDHRFNGQQGVGNVGCASA